MLAWWRLAWQSEDVGCSGVGGSKDEHWRRPLTKKETPFSFRLTGRTCTLSWAARLPVVARLFHHFQYGRSASFLLLRSLLSSHTPLSSFCTGIGLVSGTWIFAKWLYMLFEPLQVPRRAGQQCRKTSSSVTYHTVPLCSLCSQLARFDSRQCCILLTSLQHSVDISLVFADIVCTMPRQYIEHGRTDMSLDCSRTCCASRNLRAGFDASVQAIIWSDR